MSLYDIIIIHILSYFTFNLALELKFGCIANNWNIYCRIVTVTVVAVSIINSSYWMILRRMKQTKVISYLHWDADIYQLPSFLNNQKFYLKYKNIICIIC